MTFKKNWILRYRCTEHLCVSFYDEIDGVAQKQGAPLSVGAISVYLGGEGEEYEAHVSEGASARGTSITFSPDYYRTYLQSRFGSVGDMRRAFLEADGRHDMPDLVNLLKKARSYKGTGMAAELFYEGVISEVVAFVMQHSSFCPKEHRSIPLTREDREAIDFICGYIASNLGGDLSCSRLANQLYIGKTKLKNLFKTATGLSPSHYVAHERMEEAARLLAETDLAIAEIGEKVAIPSRVHLRRPSEGTGAARPRSSESSAGIQSQNEKSALGFGLQPDGKIHVAWRLLHSRNSPLNVKRPPLPIPHPPRR